MEMETEQPRDLLCCCYVKITFRFERAKHHPDLPGKAMLNENSLIRKLYTINKF